MSQAPIGIFDSGIGGLTVARAIAKYLPNHQIIYFGDTAHAPWGDKSATIINQYAGKICEFLLAQGCKHIVVACNTASAICLPHIQQIINQKATLYNVIDPVIDYIANKNFANIGLIGTKQTIAANSYPYKANAAGNNSKFHTLATPLLVPLIEEGLIEHQATKIILAEYLNHRNLQNIQALILGCTHYPILKDEISNFFIDKNMQDSVEVEIIDCAQQVALSLCDKLASFNNKNEDELSASSPLPVTNHFYLSDDNQFFCKATEQFFGQEGLQERGPGPGPGPRIKVEKICLWD